MRLFPFRSKSADSSQIHSVDLLQPSQRGEDKKQMSCSNSREPSEQAGESNCPSVIECRLTQSINTHFYSEQTPIRKTSHPAKPTSDELCQQCKLTRQRPWTRSIQSLWPALCSCQSESASFLYQLSGTHSQICNIFWKSSLTFHPYTCGSKLVDFGELWPDGSHLSGLLLDLYRLFGSEASVYDVADVVISCGPLRVLEALVSQKLIDINLRSRELGCLLHRACIRQNKRAVVYLTSAGVEASITDYLGRTADQVCFSRHVYDALPKQYRHHNVTQGRRKGSAACSEEGSYNKSPLTDASTQLIFSTATDSRQTDKLLVLLQSTQFDVNRERDDEDNLLVHIITKHGLAGLPLLYMLNRQYGASVNERGCDGLTCLMMAVKQETNPHIFVDALLCMLGADPNMTQVRSGWTALHYACHNGAFERVSTLIKRGADVNIEDLQGNRADDIAALLRHDDCVQVIQIKRKQRTWLLNNLIEQDLLTLQDLRSADLFNTDRHGYTLIMQAARVNAMKSLEMLLSCDKAPVNAQHAQTLDTALAMAVEENHIEAVESLLKHGALPSVKNIAGELPVHKAVLIDSTEIIDCLLQQLTAYTGLQTALRLCQSPLMKETVLAAVTKRQNEIITPALFECSVRGDAQKLYCILEPGDDVNPMSSGGDWPLSLAVENGHYDVVTLLVQHGGDYKKAHLSSQNNLLHLASSRGYTKILTYLLILIMSQNPHDDVTGSRHKMVNALNEQHQTPLVMAAEKGFSQAVQVLLKYGASTAVLTLTGQMFSCPLYQGIQFLIEKERQKHTWVVMDTIKQTKSSLTQLEKVFMEFDHSLRDVNGDTPLMFACSLGKQNVVKFLLQSITYQFYSRSTSTSSSMVNMEADSLLNSTTTYSPVLHAITDDGFVEQGPTKPDQLLNVDHAVITSSHPVCHNDLSPDIVKQESIDKPVENNDVHQSPKLPKSSSDPAITRELSDSRPSSRPHISQHRPDLVASLPVDDGCYANIAATYQSGTACLPGSVFDKDYTVNHLFAVNRHDGATAYHRLLESGDHVKILHDLMACDTTAVNIQDAQGLSPLHLACKLTRRKCVTALTQTVYVDLNCRTLDGRLPEEMTTDKKLVKTITEARHQHPLSEARCPMRSLPSSIYGTESVNPSTLDFDLLNSRFQLMKQQGCEV